MQPGYGQQPAYAPPINNNLTISIISVFLFWPLAIPAIINATKVGTLQAQGDLAGAQHAADQAKKFAKLGIIIGGVLLGLSILLFCGSVILAATLDGTSSSY